MKRRVMGFLCAMLLLFFCPVRADGTVLYDAESGEDLESLLWEDDSVWPTVATPGEGAPTVQAKGAILMDQATGTVLYEQNGREGLPIASVTKVMTLLLVMEALEEGRLEWQEPVTCSATAAALGGSQIWLEPGEIMTVEDLVKAATVVSANDACAALAEHLCGSQAAFVAEMNRRAAELGAENTDFRDCSGLDDGGHSCAYDVALMSRELMKHKEIQKFTTIWMDSLRGGQSQLVNTNKLVRHYNGATGLKTGTTSAAGYCLSATATRDGTSFIAVVLGSDTTGHRFDGARALLDYAFAKYMSFTPPEEWLAADPVPVLMGQQRQVAVTVELPEGLLLEKGIEKELSVSWELAQDVEAPVEPEQVMGSWRLMRGETELCRCDVRAVDGVLRRTFRSNYTQLTEALLK